MTEIDEEWKKRSDACTEGRVEFGETRVAWMWAPQVGGYASHARVELSESDDEDPCFDVRIWHDGEFPIELHACSAEQWLTFGARLAKLNGLDEDAVHDIVSEAFAKQRSAQR